MNNFEERLKGGHPNSLGNTIEIVEEVLMDKTKFDDLFQCYFSKDEVVRLRTSNALKKICREEKTIIVPYIDRLINDISQIDQASTKWTLSQLFGMLEEDMNNKQIEKAKNIMKDNLEKHTDWIVLNMTMETLAKWAENDEELKKWLKPQFEKLANDKRKSVSNKANRLMREN